MSFYVAGKKKEKKKIMKKSTKFSPVKPLILLPIFFTFIFTLGGCSSSPSSIVIRDVTEAVFANPCAGNTECLFNYFENQPEIPYSTPILLREINTMIYASFNTGRAATGAISWTLTLDGEPIPPITSPHEIDEIEDGIIFQPSDMGMVTITFMHYIPDGELRLTARANGVPDRPITLTQPGRGGLAPSGSQRQ